ncbi:MAG: hypothetical protein JKY52_06065 [Flavobacteriales bacterium]|nr:hypothetical protein [Flavobacteriales bacterium]
MYTLLRRAVLLAIAVITGSLVFAQSEISAFTATGRAGAATTFVTDYQATGINPANLGWKPTKDKKIALGFLEGGYSIFSEALVKSDLVSSFKSGNTKFTNEEKIQAGKDFTEAGFTAT